VKKALLDVFGSRCDALAATMKPSWTVPRLVKNLKSGDYLISFNYDRLAEQYALNEGILLEPASRLPIGIGSLIRGLIAPNNIVLAKPHGSASWNMFKHPIDDDPALPSILSANVVPAQVEPLLLGAVPIKSELIREVQCNNRDVFNLVMRHWLVLCYAVATCQTLVVAGYSFPKEDLYGRFLFEEAIRFREDWKTGPLRVELYEHQKAEALVAREIVRMLKPHTLVLRGPVKGASKP
jgi:hypothetical protein